MIPSVLIACPLTETRLATQHLIRNRTFPSVNIGVCGALIKFCTQDPLEFLPIHPSPALFPENLGEKYPDFPVFRV